MATWQEHLQTQPQVSFLLPTAVSLLCKRTLDRSSCYNQLLWTPPDTTACDFGTCSFMPFRTAWLSLSCLTDPPLLSTPQSLSEVISQHFQGTFSPVRFWNV